MTTQKKTEQKHPKTSSKTTLLLLGTLLLGILIGIGAKLVFDFVANQKKQINTEAPKEQTPNEKVPTDTNSLPQNFPQDFPIYPGATLKTSWTTQGELKEGISVLWESKKTTQEIANYYKTTLPGLGWSVGPSYESEGSYTISFEKVGSEGFIGITQGEEGITQISVTLGIEIISI